MRLKFRKIIIVVSYAGVILLSGIALATYLEIQPINNSLHTVLSDAQILQIVDRNNYPLSISYQNRWNTYDNLALYQIPKLLQTAFITSEDKHYYQHAGIDWPARVMALWQNSHAHRNVRGASTITEQVVHLLHPRPRTLWSKWLESFEAMSLERDYNKADILEFYLNQVPYAANRRGVLQASRYYFNRDLSTLTPKEMLALVVLARAPSSYDLFKNPQKINSAIARLAQALYQQQQLTATQLADIQQQPFNLQSPAPPVNASHFVSFVRTHAPVQMTDQLHTTLDANLQQKIQAILDQRMKNLQWRAVNNAAVLVVDHTNAEILAWVVAGANSGATAHPVAGYQMDAVTVARQPGSAMKPFLYALALETGWSPATIIEDSPLSTAIGNGLHRFKNYSNTFYGEVTLREALGNSLNIPAVRTIEYVGTQAYLTKLHALGFTSLDKNSDFYDEGLALGNGEVTLFELVQGYTALANRGIFRPLRYLLDNDLPIPKTRIYSAAVSSLIANILSDPWARHLEFGYNSVLNLPVQTAVKTGTSTDYRDAWVVGFNYRYVVGIWMGNLDRTPMDGVTGSTGPALVMRSIFAELNQNQTTSPLYLSPQLIKKDIVLKDHGVRTEYFINHPKIAKLQQPPTPIKFVLPTDGLQIALDPRIPREKQKLLFQIQGLQPQERIAWILNDNTLAITTTPHYLWPLQRGKYTLAAIINPGTHQAQHLAPVQFMVK